MSERVSGAVCDGSARGGSLDARGSAETVTPENSLVSLNSRLGLKPFRWRLNVFFAAAKLQSKLVPSDICGSAAVVILGSSFTLFSRSHAPPRMNNAGGEGLTSG